MAGLRDRSGLQTTTTNDRDKNLPYLPHQPTQTYHPNAPSDYSALPPMRSGDGYAPPHGTAVQEQYGGNQYGGNQGDAASYTTGDSNQFEYSNYNPDGNKKGFRKLMKRRP